MSEPIVTRQTAENLTEAERLEWLRTCIDEARVEGVTWSRASVKGGILLYEGWRSRPADEGEPRFSFISARHT